jgi:hypothetical protein
MRRLAAAAIPLLAAACTREPAPAPQASAPAGTLAPAPATTTTTTTTLPPPVWRTVRWGMSREEVLAALPDARRLKAPEAFGQPTPGSTDVVIPEMTEGALRYRVLLGFAAAGLDRIHVVVPKANIDSCGDVEKALTAMHGAPSGRGQIGGSLSGESVAWTLPAETITLACTGKPSLGFYSVTIDHVPPAAPAG